MFGLFYIQQAKALFYCYNAVLFIITFLLLLLYEARVSYDYTHASHALYYMAFKTDFSSGAHYNWHGFSTLTITYSSHQTHMKHLIHGKLADNKNNNNKNISTCNYKFPVPTAQTGNQGRKLFDRYELVKISIIVTLTSIIPGHPIKNFYCMQL